MFPGGANHTASADAVTVDITAAPAAGPPQVSVALVGQTAPGDGQVVVNLKVTNAGAGQAYAVTVDRVQIVKVLRGRGAVTLVTPTPLDIGSLPPGGTALVPITLNLAPTVLQVGVIDRLSYRDGAGALLQTALSHQAVGSGP